MNTAIPRRGLGRRRSIAAIAFAIAAIASAESYAWYHFRAGRAAVAADRPDAAREHLGRCRTIWPWNRRADAHLLNCRADIQAGDPEAARKHLNEARRLGGSTTPEMAFEWSLLRANEGAATEVAEYLQGRADADPALQKIVWQALAEGYLAGLRANDAYTIARRWTDRFPDDLRGLEYRGRAAIQGRGRGLTLGAEDLREVLRREPGRTKTRGILAVALLDSGRFGEALPELERLTREEPDRPEHRVRLARCLMMTDRAGEAVRLLDDVLRSHPDHGPALRTRGQFALGELRYPEAEAWLRRAAEVLPDDYQTHYLYYQALQQSGQTQEAAAQLVRAEAIKARGIQLAELRTRRVAERPLDPAVYAEMGTLLLKSGHPEQGIPWLEAALSLDPGFRPAHEALAGYYETTGRADRAAPHRRALGEGR